MSAAVLRAQGASRRPTVALGRIAHSAVAVFIGTYALAFAVRLWAISLVSFPMTEGSAYYVAVASNLVEGRGLVIDALWSYTTPPLMLPRPAFELWQPMATFLAAIPMSLNQPDFRAAQLAFAAFGALVAPLTWMVARDAARRLRLSERRAWFVSVGAGVVAAVSGPFLFATAVPDSSLPFTVFGVGACLAMPAALVGNRTALLVLGALLGLCYLTRMEAVWMGLTFVAMLLATRASVATTLQRSSLVAGIAALVAGPWWLRNLSVFGSPFPGQVAENIFFTRNEQVYAFLEQPTFDGFLSQGLAQIVTHMGQAIWHQAVDVLLVPAAPVVLVGLATLLYAAWRRGRAAAAGSREVGDDSHGIARGSMAALLASGGIIFVATAVLFPVATLWGTFQHASGPLLVGLIVAALLGGDRFVAWLAARRRWARENGWLAPAALIALTLPLTLLQMGGAQREAAFDQASMATVAADLPGALASSGIEVDAPLITDRPIWLSGALGRSTLALPDEPVDSVLALARAFDAPAVVVVEGRGHYPADLFQTGQACFTALSASATGGASVFVIDEECMR